MSLLPPTEFDRFRTIIFHGLSNQELCTDFDYTFLLDFHRKFEQYKRHTFVSDRQEEQFDRIEKYLREELSGEYSKVTFNDG